MTDGVGSASVARTFAALYTKHKTQRQKRWMDGTLVVAANASRATLYDERGREIDSLFVPAAQRNVCAGDELESELFLIAVEECVGGAGAGIAEPGASLPPPPHAQQQQQPPPCYASARTPMYPPSLSARGGVASGGVAAPRVPRHAVDGRQQPLPQQPSATYASLNGGVGARSSSTLADATEPLSSSSSSSSSSSFATVSSMMMNRENVERASANVERAPSQPPQPPQPPQPSTTTATSTTATRKRALHESYGQAPAQQQPQQHGFHPGRAVYNAVSGGAGGAAPRSSSSSSSSPSEPPTVYERLGLDADDERLRNVDAELLDRISNEILRRGAPITWDDIAGLEFAKSTVQEAIIWPMLRPDIFCGLRAPPRGLLLFGPPGTGKTLIGKAIANECKGTFFSISASSLTSKWIGEGEKTVRAMFALARCLEPSVVFIDEIDSLLTARSSGDSESSRRLKTEFLVQFDGVASGSSSSRPERVLVIGATNLPWELDEAVRRRMTKRLYVPLPCAEARARLLAATMDKLPMALSDDERGELVRRTDGYSGSDLKALCNEASLGPIRNLGAHNIGSVSLDAIRAVSFADFCQALHSVRSSVSPDQLHAFVHWEKQFGSKG